MPILDSLVEYPPAHASPGLIELGFVGQRLGHTAFVKKAFSRWAVGDCWDCFAFLSANITVRWSAGPLET